MKKNTDASPTTETLKLIGDLTIERAQELHQKLLTSLHHTTQLTITFEEVTSVDLAFLQLLCAAHRTAVRAGKTMRLDLSRPEVLQRAVQAVGFRRVQGCALDSQGSCLWKEGWS